MRSITHIVIHCSASPNGQSLFQGRIGSPGRVPPVKVIDGWHQQRGFHRDPLWRKRFNPDLAAIGYHFVIYTNSAVASGRHLDEVGAHVQGRNANSIAICLVGTDKFTAAQWGVLPELLADLRKRYPNARICGHRDLSPDVDGDGVVRPHEWLKICPGFDVAAWLKGGMAPLAAHLLEA